MVPGKGKSINRIGYGYDLHRLQEGRKLVLGGVYIPHVAGLQGHSDADVLIHAIIDSLLGALALGDIGTHFPDTDPAFKDADSRELLRRTAGLIFEKGYRVGNVDSTVVAESPRLRDLIEKMRANIAADLHADVESVSVKATTSERIGMIGRKEGISAMAVCLLVAAKPPVEKK